MHREFPQTGWNPVLFEHERDPVTLRKACVRLGHVRDPSYGVLRVASKHRESVLLRRDLCGIKFRTPHAIDAK